MKSNNQLVLIGQRNIQTEKESKVHYVWCPKLRVPGVAKVFNALLVLIAEKSPSAYVLTFPCACKAPCGRKTAFLGLADLH